MKRLVVLLLMSVFPIAFYGAISAHIDGNHYLLGPKGTSRDYATPIHDFDWACMTSLGNSLPDDVVLPEFVVYEGNKYYVVEADFTRSGSKKHPVSIDASHIRYFYGINQNIVDRLESIKFSESLELISGLRACTNLKNWNGFLTVLSQSDPVLLKETLTSKEV